MSRISLISPSGCQIPDAARPLRVRGIDLGTTNSTVAEILRDPAKPQEADLRCIEIDQPTSAGLYTNTLVPSIVTIENGRT